MGKNHRFSTEFLVDIVFSEFCQKVYTVRAVTRYWYREGVIHAKSIKMGVLIHEIKTHRLKIHHVQKVQARNIQLLIDGLYIGRRNCIMPHATDRLNSSYQPMNCSQIVSFEIVWEQYKSLRREKADLISAL